MYFGIHRWCISINVRVVPQRIARRTSENSRDVQAVVPVHRLVKQLRFTTKLSSYLVELHNQDRRLDVRRRDPSAPRSFDAGGHMAGS
jgi:hypothetical protein